MAGVYPVKVVCCILPHPPSSYYHQLQEKDEEYLKAAIQEVCGRYPSYGYLRVTAQVRRAGWRINRKRVYKLMSENGTLGQNRPQKRQMTNNEHPFPCYPDLAQELVIENPDQVGVADISYIRRGGVHLPGYAHGRVHLLHS